MDSGAAHSGESQLTRAFYDAFKESQQRLSSQLWELFSIATLNASFVAELLRAHGANKESVERINKDLDKVAQEAKDVQSRTEGSLEPLQETRRAFEETRGAVDGFAATLEQLRSQFDGIRSTFASFQETVDKIAATLGEIDDVSDLTHLLALNASIEAARAGRHGVGFKVVAEEIKKLSDKSADLTNQTNQLVDEVRTTLSQAVENLGSYEDVRAGVDSDLSAAKTHLQEQAERIDRVDENIRSMAESMRRQSDQTQSIRESMDQLETSVRVADDAARHVTTSLEHQDRTIAEAQRLDGEQRSTLREHTARLSDAGVIAGEEAAVLIGHDVAYPPWVSVGDGRSTGISIEICEALARELNMAVAFEASQFEDVLESFLAERIDMITNVGWPNPSFDGKKVLATEPYAAFEPVVFTLSGRSAVPPSQDAGHGLREGQEAGHGSREAGLEDPEAFAGRRIAVQRASYIAAQLERINASLVPVADDLEGMAKVLWQQVDGVATERQVGRYMSRSYFGGALVEASTPLARINVVMVLSERQAELRDRINEALRSETISAIRARKAV